MQKLLNRDANLVHNCIIVIDVQESAVGQIAVLQAGYPFRGAIEEVPDGDVHVVQMKDVGPEGGVAWAGALRTTLPGRRRPEWLHEGDVLFVAKGARFYAALVDSPPAQAVCSPALFRIRVSEPALIDPAFLAWQINQPPFQRQLHQAAEGSGQLSIRRPVLEALTLSVPPLARQRSFVALADLARRERRALQHLINNRERQLHALAESLAHSHE
jgi:hypothetical protein